MIPGVKFLHSLFEVAHVEFQAYDLEDHKLIFSSGVARQLLGYSEDEYLKLSTRFFKEIIYPDDFPIVQDTIDKISPKSLQISADLFLETIRLINQQH